MLKSHKFRLYPTKDQEILLNEHFGACRYVYNLGLEAQIEAWTKGKHISKYDLQSQLVGLKEVEPWLKEVSAASLQITTQNLDIAYQKFFGGGGFPKFKKKGIAKDSFTVLFDIKLKDNKISIEKFREGISIELSRPIKGKIKRATVSKTKTGKYFISLLCDTGESLPDKPEVTEETAIGIDTGIKSFLTLSDGREFENPKFLSKSLERLKTLQKRSSKKELGSSNRKKANLKVAKLHEKIHNQRIDYIHKTTHQLTHENQVDTLIVETLLIKNMMKNHKLAQALSDVSLSEFYRQLEYKCDWYGKNFIKINRFFASSKTCSKCGAIKEDLALSDRLWQCKSCETVHHRDINAAVNIKNEGLRQYKSSQGLAEVSLENCYLGGSAKEKVSTNR